MPPETLPGARLGRVAGALEVLRESGLAEVDDPREPVLRKIRRWQRLRHPSLRPRLEERRAHDVRWAGWFEEEAVRLRVAVGDAAQRLEHIGSTAIPGLSSKNVLDLLLAVDDVGLDAPWRTALSRLDYVDYGGSPCDREAQWFWRVADERAFVLHVCAASNPWITTALRFRDYLRRHPQDREAYEARKRELRRRGIDDPFRFAVAKLEVFYEICRRADRWAEGG